MDMTEYYAYTGDIKKLIPNGWTFNKMFAENKIAYEKNSIFMYRTRGMIIQPNLFPVGIEFQSSLIKFILDNRDKPESFWREKSIVYPDTGRQTYKDNYVLTDQGNIVTEEQGQKLYVDAMVFFSRFLDSHDMNPPDELKNEALKKKQSMECGSGKYHIRYEKIVRPILELDSIHPLELVSV